MTSVCFIATVINTSQSMNSLSLYSYVIATVYRHYFKETL